MNQDIFEQDLINILGRDMEESRIIDDKMEEAYARIRQMKGNRKKTGKEGKKGRQPLSRHLLSVPSIRHWQKRFLL